MQPTIEILNKVSRNSMENKDEVFTRLYRYMLRTDIYYTAYRNLYANHGAATKGVNDDTADGFSEEKVQAIIAGLADESYRPLPARRVYIAKANGKLRPLGLPTFTDKLVQEVLRMILESVYEPVFSDCSHGFRPNRSCHTALKDVRHKFYGTNWFIEGDIKGCFDNIDHQTLIKVIGKKIRDARLTALIWKFLKAGYLEDWRYHRTYSGTPQGGIISPILANIYLNELDGKVAEMSKAFHKPSDGKVNREYYTQQQKVRSLRRKLNRPCNAGKRAELFREWREARAEMMKLPAKSQTDKEIKYVRYADDFIIGVNGSKADCEKIKAELKAFIAGTLKMELSEEKTLITHSSKTARFLGYDIRVRRSNQLKSGGCGTKGKLPKRTLNYMTELTIPLKEKIEAFLFRTKTVEIKNGALYPVRRTVLVGLSDMEIVTAYNAELRGICNYYRMACNFNKLAYFAYLMEYSCLKTLAAKHRSTVNKVKATFRDGKGGWGIPYQTKKGEKRMYFADYVKCKSAKETQDKQPLNSTWYWHSPNTLEKRLAARKCELCGTETAERYEVHHVRKVKELKGKEHWERVMIAKRRKTMVVCWECHHKIIHGKRVSEDEKQ